MTSKMKISYYFVLSFFLIIGNVTAVAQDSVFICKGNKYLSVAVSSRITPLGAKLRHYKIDELPELWDVLIGNMSFVGPRPDVPGYADLLEGNDRDVLRLRPGITGPATLKYRLEDEMIAEYVKQKQENGDLRTSQEIAVEYNDKIIYPDKVRLNCYYYRTIRSSRTFR